MEIRINNVCKDYATVRAVNQVSFTVEPGGIVALLGPNGAGKSSLVRMLVGLTEPDVGSIEVQWQGQIFRYLPDGAFGYLPEDRGLYQDRTLRQNLVYIGQLRGLTKQQINDQLDHWLERFELTDRADENLKQLSKGNQQKIQLISTLLHQPPMVILDEPFSGLDPVNQENVLSVLKELKKQGVTILLSAHQMDLVERLADRFILMNKGQVIANGQLNDIHQQLSTENRVILRYSEPVLLANLADQALSDFADLLGNPLASDAEVTELSALVADDIPMHEVMLQASKVGKLEECRRERLALHDLYLQAVRGSDLVQEKPQPSKSASATTESPVKGEAQ